jgi:hypothetical protein
VTRLVAELPPRFCWTRFGTEAGQRIQEILDRKERERRANGGLFLWGIGNSVRKGVRELVRNCDQPEVVFSPIKGSPRSVDVHPGAVLSWTAGETLEGEPYTLPAASLVLSGSKLPARRSHYALVCYSPTPIIFEGSAPTLPFGRLRNLCSGNPVGWSQVTAVVDMAQVPESSGHIYPVAFRASLAFPYFLRLTDPIEIAARPS